MPQGYDQIPGESPIFQFLDLRRSQVDKYPTWNATKNWTLHLNQNKNWYEQKKSDRGNWGDSMCGGHRERLWTVLPTRLWSRLGSNTWNSNLAPLLEGLCTSNLCNFEFSFFWLFARIKLTTSGLTVPRSDNLSESYIVLDNHEFFYVWFHQLPRKENTPWTQTYYPRTVHFHLFRLFCGGIVLYTLKVRICTSWSRCQGWPILK